MRDDQTLVGDARRQALPRDHATTVDGKTATGGD